jgi:hypothetical protein
LEILSDPDVDEIKIKKCFYISEKILNKENGILIFKNVLGKNYILFEDFINNRENVSEDGIYN